MDIDKAFPSKYLGVADLNDKRVTLTIKDVQSENVGQGQANKLVASFRGTPKKLVLNKTNAIRIATVAGSRNTDNWSGTKITLMPATTEFQGETKPCIRVVVPAVAAPARTGKTAVKAKVVEPEPDDPIPDFPDEEESADHDEPDPDDDPFGGV